MNSYDSDRLLESVRGTHEQVKSPEKADIIVFNTCHIREKAAEKIYSELGKIKEIKKSNSDSKLIIAGCVAQAEGKAMISRQPIIDAVIGPQMYHKFNKVIEEVKNKKVFELDFDSKDKFKSLKKKRLTFSASAFVTIQEGCDKFCSFCVVPFTRGAEVSRKSYHIFEEVNHLVENGCKEVVLLGQNVNAYHGVDKYNNEIDGELYIKVTGTYVGGAENTLRARDLVVIEPTKLLTDLDITPLTIQVNEDNLTKNNLILLKELFMKHPGQSNVELEVIGNDDIKLLELKSIKVKKSSKLNNDISILLS